MLKLYDTGVYLINGRQIATDAGEAARAAGRPVSSGEAAKGTIAWGLSMDEAFAMRGVETDLLHDGRSHLIHAHRTMPNAEIYFVACFGGKPAPSVDVSFRVSGRVPELWDAATGEMREADTWRFENGRTLIIAKDQATKAWATSNVTGGTTAISDRRAAIADFDGRAKTSTILTTLGANAPAAKYCNEYHPSNVDSADSNMGAGRWWLPSLGEMAMIWAHVREINFVMAAISGTAIPVGSSWGWSSTEYSATGAWGLLFSIGYFDRNYKTLEGLVRPVSAFY